MLKTLHESGLAEHRPYEGVRLTTEGTHLALRVLRRHRLIELFLQRTLELTWDEVHEEAEHMEHAVSDLLVDRIDAFLNFPTIDPHGDPIPRSDGSLTTTAQTPLHHYRGETLFRLERVLDQSPEFLRYLSEIGLGIGATGKLLGEQLRRRDRSAGNRRWNNDFGIQLGCKTARRIDPWMKLPPLLNTFIFSAMFFWLRKTIDQQKGFVVEVIAVTAPVAIAGICSYGYAFESVQTFGARLYNLIAVEFLSLPLFVALRLVERLSNHEQLQLADIFRTTTITALATFVIRLLELETENIGVVLCMTLAFIIGDKAATASPSLYRLATVVTATVGIHGAEHIVFVSSVFTHSFLWIPILRCLLTPLCIDSLSLASSVQSLDSLRTHRSLCRSHTPCHKRMRLKRSIIARCFDCGNFSQRCLLSESRFVWRSPFTNSMVPAAMAERMRKGTDGHSREKDGTGLAERARSTGLLAGN